MKKVYSYYVEYEFIYKSHAVRECTIFETVETNRAKAIKEFKQKFDRYDGVYVIEFELKARIYERWCLKWGHQ